MAGKTDIDIGVSRGRRVVISAVVLVLVSAMLLSGLPSSGFREATKPFHQPIIGATGLAQSWGLFDHPRAHTLQLEAHLKYRDGSSATWRPPRGDRFIGVYRSFRWRKWANGVQSTRREYLYAPAALFIASVNRRRGDYPVEVTLLKLSYEAPPPGSGEPRDHDPRWDKDPYYTLELLAPPHDRPIKDR